MILFTVLLCVAAATAEVNYSGHKVLRAHPTSEHHLKWLHTLQHEFDFWKEPRGLNQAVDIRVTPDNYRQLRTGLRYNRIPHSVLHEDVQSLIDQSKTRPNKAPIDDFIEYKDFDEIEAYIVNTVAACGTRCTLEDIGDSYEGRDIHLVKITNGDSIAKKGLWVDSGIHAREWLAFSTGLFFIDRLVYDFGTDAEVDEILANYDVYIVPALNPDGYVYTWTDDRMWRKSRQPHSPCTGADINRNFDFMWMSIGASDNPCSDTFAGPEAHSESESVAVRDYIMARQGNWDLYMTMHTYGQLWMAPYGYTTAPPANYDELMRVANIGADALTAVHGTEYERGSASEILYASSGTSRDWAAGVPQIPYVYTLELRNENSFILPSTEILPTAEETWAGFKAAVNAIINA